ncbi:unnamed protein product [Diplocarpon coronariae]
METRQHICSSGCGKAFSRKEHLARHEKTHDPENLLLCQVCKREFNRNDSLQRHLVQIHGDAYKPGPSGRSKRACISCRTLKTKCDGNDHCTTCKKKGIECRYRPENQIVDGQSPAEQQTESPSGEPPEPMDVDQSSMSRVSSDCVSRDTAATQIHEEPPRRSVPDTFNLTKPTGLVDWSAVKIVPDKSSDENVPRPDPAFARYVDAYFTHFHHHWTVIHRPTFNEEENTLVVSSARMIGAWLLGHDTLVEQLLPRLCTVTSLDRLYQSLSLESCQSALLNIIFTLYSGNDSLISRAITLKGILISALRQVGFFKPETAWIDEKSGYFLPMRLVRLGSRQRMASYLFKIDAYLSILRDQPAGLLPEELHFPIPSTFALYNADGLHTWESRQKREPIYRSQKPISKLIDETVSSPKNETPLLIEDIQTGLCAVQSNIWKAGASSTCQMGLAVRRDTLKRQLGSLKARLDNMMNEFSEDVNSEQEKHLILRHYHGYEDPAQLGWQNAAVARVEGLFFATAMLYHLCSLQLSAELRTLTNLAKDRRLGPVEEASNAHQQAREERVTAMKVWGSSPAARWSLCHAADVLVAHQNIGRYCHHDRRGPTLRTLDPVANIALSLAGLVIWAYCTLNIQGCHMCMPGSAAIIELTRWSAPGVHYEEKDTWIEEGKGCRVQLQGTQLCSCNVEFLMALFQTPLPDTWTAADAIAPGVFQSTS